MRRRIRMMQYGPSDSARALARGLGIRRLRLEGSRFVQRDGDVLVNWGRHVWFGPFEGAQREVAGMVRALAAPGLDGRPGDVVKLLVNGPLALLSAEKAVGDVCEIIPAQYGDTWLRDTGPIFLANDRACTFGFNGWGSCRTRRRSATSSSTSTARAASRCARSAAARAAVTTFRCR